jgi:hypothetical protein
MTIPEMDLPAMPWHIALIGHVGFDVTSVMTSSDFLAALLDVGFGKRTQTFHLGFDKFGMSGSHFNTIS